MASIIETLEGTWRCQVSFKGKRATKTFKTKEAASLWGEATEGGMRRKNNRLDYTDKCNAAQSLLATGVPKRVLDAMAATEYSREDILDAAIPVKNVMGLYFLVNDGEVVYVGQSTDVFARISKHRRNGKEFNSFSFLPCPDQGALDALESTYILALVPVFNLSLGRIPAGARIYED